MNGGRDRQCVVRRTRREKKIIRDRQCISRPSMRRTRLYDRGCNCSANRGSLPSSNIHDHIHAWMVSLPPGMISKFSSCRIRGHFFGGRQCREYVEQLDAESERRGVPSGMGGLGGGGVGQGKKTVFVHTAHRTEKKLCSRKWNVFVYSTNQTELCKTSSSSKKLESLSCMSFSVQDWSILSDQSDQILPGRDRWQILPGCTRGLAA